MGKELKKKLNVGEAIDPGEIPVNTSSKIDGDENYNMTKAGGIDGKKQLSPNGDKDARNVWWKRGRKSSTSERLGGLNLTPSRPQRNRRLFKRTHRTPSHDYSQPLITKALTPKKREEEKDTKTSNNQE